MSLSEQEKLLLQHWGDWAAVLGEVIQEYLDDLSRRSGVEFEEGKLFEFSAVASDIVGVWIEREVRHRPAEPLAARFGGRSRLR